MHTNQRSRLLIACFITAGIAALWLCEFRPILYLETCCDDLLTQLGRKAPVSNQIVFCGIQSPSSIHIDPSTLGKDSVLNLFLKPYPWSRQLWAKLLTTLFTAKAKLVVFDLYFDEPREGDTAFKTVLEKHKSQVVMGCIWNPLTRGATTIDNWLTPHETLLGTNWDEEPFVEDGVVGHTYVPMDWDGVMRSFQKNVYSEGLHLPIESLMSRAVRKLGMSSVLLSSSEHQRFRFAGGAGTFPMVPVQEVLTPSLLKNKYEDGRFFDDKVVVVGATGSWSGDQKQTPFRGPMDGAEVQINILNAMLQGQLLSQVHTGWCLLIMALAGVFGCVSGLFVSKSAPFLGAIVTGNTLYLFGVIYAYNSFNLILPILSPILIFTCVVGVIFTRGPINNRSQEAPSTGNVSPT